VPTTPTVPPPPPPVEPQPVPPQSPTTVVVPPGPQPAQNIPLPTPGFGPVGPNSTPFVQSGGSTGFQPQPAIFSGSGLNIAPRRFPLTIDPKTPVKELLPVAPTVKDVGPLVSDDLGRVPEVEFMAPVAKDGEAMQKVAHTIARINHLNGK